jgi:drug/metabolite transporter (DMT)-like permease
VHILRQLLDTHFGRGNQKRIGWKQTGKVTMMGMISSNQQMQEEDRLQIWMRGIGFAFATAIFFGCEGLGTKIFDEEKKSIIFSYFCTYVCMIFVYGSIGRADGGVGVAVEGGVDKSGDALLKNDYNNSDQTHAEKLMRAMKMEGKKRTRVCFETCRTLLTPNQRSLKLFAMSLFDFIGNYSVIMAFEYTSVTSGTIFNSATVPVSLCLSYFFMSRVYGKMHYLGAAIAVCGLLLLIISDKENGPSEQESNPILGDFLALMAACSYSLSNIIQESFIDSGMSMSEIFSAFGLYGSKLTFAALVLEHRFSASRLLEFFKSVDSLYEFSTYAVFSVLVLMGYVASYEALSRVDAGTFNVVLLTQCLFVGLVRLDGFDGGFTQLQGLVFFATFFVQMVGISIFSFAGDVKGDGDENGNERR